MLLKCCPTLQSIFVLKKACNLNWVSFSAGSQNNGFLGNRSNDAWAAHFCGEMPVKCLGKWAKRKEKKKRSLPLPFSSHVAAKSNLQDEKANTNVNSNHRIWILVVLWSFGKLAADFSNLRCWCALEYNFSKWPALIKKIRADLSSCFHKITRSLYIHVGGYSALTSTWLTYSASLSLDVDAAVESGCREQLTQDYCADMASHNIGRDIIIFLFEVFFLSCQNLHIKTSILI